MDTGDENRLMTVAQETTLPSADLPENLDLTPPQNSVGAARTLQAVGTVFKKVRDAAGFMKEELVYQHVKLPLLKRALSDYGTST